MRKGGNIAEARLWNELKDRKLGDYKFVRQHVIRPYYADFACRERRLVVEVDGSQHADSQSDRVRDAALAAKGWSTLRLWNVDVLKEMTSVRETILAVLEGRLAENVSAYDMRLVMSKKTKSIEARPPHRLAALATSPPLREGEESPPSMPRPFTSQSGEEQDRMAVESALPKLGEHS